LCAARFAFADKKLEQLFMTGKGAERFPPEVVAGFFKAIQVISTAPDERTLYGFKGLRSEKLSGKRRGQHSLRLNKQFRLTFELVKDAHGNLLWILDLEDYH
jgi:toxin HigB-1